MSEDTKTSKACDSCRAKKIRCDRKVPKCSYCQRQGLDCNFSQVQRPGLKTGYGRQISERISALEAFMNDTKGAVKHFQELTAKIEKLEVNLQNYQFAEEGRLPLPIVNFNRLPKPSICQRLVEIYLEQLYNIIPVIHPFLSVPNVIESLDDPGASVYGMMVTSLPICENFLNLTERRGYYDYFKSKILSDCIGMQNIDCIRAITLLVFRFLGDDSPEVKNVFLLLKSGCESLRLFEESGPNNAETEEERNLVWSIFNLDRINFLINGKSFIDYPKCLLPLAFEIALYNSNEITNQQATLNNYEGLNTFLYNSTTFCIPMLDFLCQVTKLIRENEKMTESNLINFRAQLIEQKSHVDNWLLYLPRDYIHFLTDSDFDFKGSLTVHDIILHGCYQMYLIAINSCFLLINDSYTESNHSNCYTAVDNIIKCCKSSSVVFNSQKTYRFGYLYLLSLWTAAKCVFICCVISNKEIALGFEFLFTKLSELSEIWPIASYYRDSLAKLKQEYLYNKKELIRKYQNQVFKDSKDLARSPSLETFLYNVNLDEVMLLDIFKRDQ